MFAVNDYSPNRSGNPHRIGGKHRQGAVVHQLTLLLSSRRRRSEEESSVAVASKPAQEQKLVPAAEKQLPQRCLNESAHKLYR